MEINKVILRKATKKDIPGLIQLFQTCFNKTISPEEWIWKYYNSPWGSVSYVAELDGEILAHYGAFKLRFTFKRDILETYQTCDVMSHPKIRGQVTKRPLIGRIGQIFYKENEMALAFGFPSERHCRLQVLILGLDGYRPVDSFEKMVGTTSKKKRFHIFELDEKWLSLMEQLYLSSMKDLSILKDAPYFRWRYLLRSRHSYKIIALKGLLSVKAIAVIKELSSGILLILDAFSKDRDFKDLILAIETYAKTNSFDKIKFWSNILNPRSETLKELGYKHKPDIPFAVRTVFHEKGLSGELFLKEYDYQMGDYDDV